MIPTSMIIFSVTQTSPKTPTKTLFFIQNLIFILFCHKSKLQPNPKPPKWLLVFVQFQDQFQPFSNHPFPNLLLPYPFHLLTFLAPPHQF